MTHGLTWPWFRSKMSNGRLLTKIWQAFAADRFNGYTGYDFKFIEEVVTSRHVTTQFWSIEFLLKIDDHVNSILWKCPFGQVWKIHDHLVWKVSRIFPVWQSENILRQDENCVSKKSSDVEKLRKFRLILENAWYCLNHETTVQLQWNYMLVYDEYMFSRLFSGVQGEFYQYMV